MKMKLRFLKLMLLLFILPLQILAAELGVAGKQLAALPGVSNVETLKSTHFESMCSLSSSSLMPRMHPRAISNRGWCSAIEDSTVLPCS